MVQHAIPSFEPEFDPDSHDEQPEAALHSLIERLENEVSALHLKSFNQADALALGLLLVDLPLRKPTRNWPVRRRSKACRARLSCGFRTATSGTSYLTRRCRIHGRCLVFCSPAPARFRESHAFSDVSAFPSPR